MIPETYHDEARLDRAWTDDLWSWLKDQPQDAWLLWARCANWDNAESIFIRMAEDPRCDRSVAAHLFWGADPGYHVARPESYRSGSLLHTIVLHAALGGYQRCALVQDPIYDVHHAQSYVAALKKIARGAAPFALPRILLSTMQGQPASLTKNFDPHTERSLQDIFAAIDGALPRQESEHRAQQADGGNLWIESETNFPSRPIDPAALALLDDAQATEAHFGNHEEYKGAAERIRRKFAAQRAGGASSQTTAALSRVANAIPDIRPARALKGLAVFFAIAMAIAIIMRRINFGVWF